MLAARSTRSSGSSPARSCSSSNSQILNQDPAIAAPPREGPLATLQRRRGGVLVAFGGGLLLAAAVAAMLAGGDDLKLAEANSLAVIDPASNSVVDTVPTGVDPFDVAADAEHIWVGNRGDGTVTQIDPARNEVLGTRSAETTVGGIAAGAGGVWIGDSRGERARAARSRLLVGGTLDPACAQAGGPRRHGCQPGRRRARRGLGAGRQ